MTIPHSGYLGSHWTRSPWPFHLPR